MSTLGQVWDPPCLRKLQDTLMMCSEPSPYIPYNKHCCCALISLICKPHHILLPLLSFEMLYMLSVNNDNKWAYLYSNSTVIEWMHVMKHSLQSISFQVKLLEFLSVNKHINYNEKYNKHKLNIEFVSIFFFSDFFVIRSD